MEKKLNLGTCSRKYDSRQGLIYGEKETLQYLEEYSKHYNCVKGDQWFWSLFGDKKDPNFVVFNSLIYKAVL